jgi:hypothetical protein
MKTEANTYILTKLKTKNPLSTYLAIDKWSELLNTFKYENFTTKFIDGSKTPPRFDISKMKLIENTPEDTKEFVINFNKVGYVFNTYHDKELVHYRLHQKNYDVECIHIIISKKYNSCEIHNISYDSDCMPSANIIDKKGSSLLKIALKLIEKIKDRYKLRYVQLTDNSIKKCNKYNIQLSTMLTLVTGTTWYGSYGFYPKSEQIYKYYEKNKRIVDKTLLSDILELKKMIIKAHKKSSSKIDLEKVFKSYDKAIKENALLKSYLKYFISNYDKFCELFYFFYIDVFNALNLFDMHGKVFVKKI